MTTYTLELDTTNLSLVAALVLTRETDGKVEIFLGRWEPIETVLEPILTKEIDPNALTLPILPDEILQYLPRKCQGQE